MRETTGVLTLGIHEPLTFDGTEVAIHPDLFDSGCSDRSGFGAPANSNRGETTTVGGASVDGVHRHVSLNAGGTFFGAAMNGTFGTGFVAAGGSGVQSSLRGLSSVPPGATSLWTTAFSGGQAPLAAGPGMTISSIQTVPSTAQTGTSETRPTAATRLTAGDIIELKVWDLKPGVDPAESERHRHRGTMSSHHRLLRPSSQGPLLSSRPPQIATPSVSLASAEPPGSTTPQTQSFRATPVSSPSSSTSAESLKGVPFLPVRSIGATSHNGAITSDLPPQTPSLDETDSLVEAPAPPSGPPSSASSRSTSPHPPPRLGAANSTLVSSGHRRVSTATAIYSSQMLHQTATQHPLPPLPPRPQRSLTSVSVGSATGDQALTETKIGTPFVTPQSSPARTNFGRKSAKASYEQETYGDTSFPPIEIPSGAGDATSSSRKISPLEQVGAEDSGVSPAESSHQPSWNPQISKEVSDAHRRVPSTVHVGTGDTSESYLRGHPNHDDNQGDDIDKPNPGSAIEAELLQTHILRTKLIMKVGEKSLHAIKKTSGTQISVLKQVADLYNLSSYDNVTVTLIDGKDEASVVDEESADFVTVTIKDQFVTRGEMYLLQKFMVGKWIYRGQRIGFLDGIRANVMDMRHGTDKIASGIVTESTKFTVRSRSARIIWLVQLSYEMWDYASPFAVREENQTREEDGKCELYFDKFISFFRKLFKEWKELEVTHSLTVVYFSRTYLKPVKLGRDSSQTPERPNSAVYVNKDGRQYEDHYATVVENETRSDWDALIHQLKKEFNRFPISVGWNQHQDERRRSPSSAAQGNILEAINVTLNLLQFHFMDRDLHRTGNSLVVVTPGSGVFEVDKDLAAITKQRMMDNAIGSDVLSLDAAPLHVAPFFLYKDVGQDNNDQGRTIDDWKTLFEVPHWMHLTYIRYDRRHISFPQSDDGNREKYRDPRKSSQPLFSSNGFLFRYRDGSDTDRHKPHGRSTLEDNEVVATSANRDFGDILEACRPRMGSSALQSLPSALSAILACSSERISGNDGISMYSASISPVTEWGAVDFDRVVDRLKNPTSLRSWSTNSENRVSSRIVLGSPQTPALEGPTSASDKSSESSSVSNSPFLGSRSLDLNDGLSASPPVKTYGDVSPGGMRLPPPLSFEDSTWMQAHTDREKSIRRHEESSTSSASGTSKKVKKGFGNGRITVDRLRALMSAHDADVCDPQKKSGGQAYKAPSPRREAVDEPGIDTSRHGMHSFGLKPELSTVSAASGRGGIGAALGRYNRTEPTGVGSTQGQLVRGLPSSDALAYIADESAMQRDVSAVSDLAGSPVFLSIGEPVLKESQERQHRSLWSSSVRTPPDLVLNSGGKSVLRPEGKTPGTHAVRPVMAAAGRTHDRKTRSFDTSSAANKLPREHPTSNQRSGSAAIRNVATEQRQNVEAAKRSTKRRGRLSSRGGHVSRSSRASMSSLSQGTPWVLNAFRQEEGDKVLAKFNRRRWSHVFPVGEVEFKHHAGPSWKSLCQPAILPVTSDFHPSHKDLNDPKQYKVSSYGLSLAVMDRQHYNSLHDLLMEMVMQRLIQEFQVIPLAVAQHGTTAPDMRNAPRAWSSYRDSENRTSTLLGAAYGQESGTVPYTLSMGHTIHELAIDGSSDSIRVSEYIAVATEFSKRKQSYKYMMWTPAAKSFALVNQNFSKFSMERRWNNYDNLICGDAEKPLTERTRFRRVTFGLIPNRIADAEQEQDYVAKFFRLMEYLNKQLPNGEDKAEVKVQTHFDSSVDPKDSKRSTRTKGNSQLLLTIPLIKAKSEKSDKYEWMEIMADSIFDTRRTFKLTFRWLVASSSKIEQQIQLVQRRCKQYGLHLMSFANMTISENLFLHPFIAPAMLPVRNSQTATIVENELVDSLGYISDGIQLTETGDLLGFDDFGFSKKSKGRQYVHESGSVFVRVLGDDQGWALFVVFENRRVSAGDEKVGNSSSENFDKLAALVRSADEDDQQKTFEMK